ncbi:hypothetical protein K2Z83_26560, partial [Oscillochloris sp. ZM17-4]|nr:hypothetical protein [Oscillochloris sp. ZM17-4]
MTQFAPTIGIVTALPKELRAMSRLLENPRSYVYPGTGAGRRYILGELPSQHGGSHLVALAVSGMGNNKAAIRGSQMLAHFGQIPLVMVGIAGGVPHPAKPEDHVRLGDIVVLGNEGIIQYDHVKEIRRGDKVETPRRWEPRPPSARMVEDLDFLEAKVGPNDSPPWLSWIELGLSKLRIERPAADTDIFEDSSTGDGSDDHPFDRLRRDGQPRVFRGPIASGNRLQKNAATRDRLRDQYGVKAIEMEGSGIADVTWTHDVGYLVVRGICDYCDRFKNDDWQEYAAVVAAAYTCALLETMPVEPGGPLPDSDRHTIVSAAHRADNPFPGLQSYAYADARRYAGRSTGAYVDTLVNSCQSIFFVVGPSGAGKSSLALAGLLPALERRYREEVGREVRHIIIAPRQSPVNALQRGLRANGFPVEENDDRFEADPQFLSKLLRNQAQVQQRQQHYLVVLDQFEEVFSVDVDPDERNAFFALLEALPDRCDQTRAQFIITMRSDFLGQLWKSDRLASLANAPEMTRRGIGLREPMSPAEMSAAIHAPVEWFNQKHNANYALEDGLVRQLVREACGDPVTNERGSKIEAGDSAYLPLLQTTLEELWNTGDLRLATYQEHYRSISTALSKTADAALKAVGTKEEQERAIKLLVDLVEVSIDIQERPPARRTRRLAWIMQRHDTPDDPDFITRVIHHLTERRIIITRAERIGEQAVEYVDLIHDRLITNWVRLHDAVNRDIDRLRRIAQFELKFRERKKDPAYLLDGRDLKEAELIDEADLRGLDDGSEALRFRTESLARREAQQRQRTVSLLILAIAALIFAIAATVFGFQSRQEAVRADGEAGRALQQAEVSDAQRLSALAQAALDRGETELALLLAASAVQQSDNGVMNDTLRKLLSRLAKVRAVLHGHASGVTSAAYSPDGTRIVTASADGTAKVWDAASGATLATLQGHTSGVTSAAFS